MEPRSLDFVEALNSILSEYNLSKVQLAKVLGVQHTTVYSWMKGSIKVKPSTACKIYKKFNILVKPYTPELLQDLVDDSL